MTASAYGAAGSFWVPSLEWGDLSPWNGAEPGPGTTVAAGQSTTVTVNGEVTNWNGTAPVAGVFVNQGGNTLASASVTVPFTAPNSATDTVAGLVYADRDGDGSPSAGEGLAGVKVGLSGQGQYLDTTTDATGRYRFAGIPLQTYYVYVSGVPDGWVVEAAYQQLFVDGSGSYSAMLLRATRPLTGTFTATMRFTKDVYQVGDHAEILVTLTNNGSAGLVGVRAGCDRSGGEGPELRDVDLGDLEYDRGVTVPAGQSRTFSITGTISDETAEWGGVGYACDFGPGDNPEGYSAGTPWPGCPLPPPTWPWTSTRTATRTGRSATARRSRASSSASATRSPAPS
ncbi:SdrD B-like domain-containing protein [Actinokineospora terrae]|uniref:SD-repeat containing protein B domain-containing protein n=1 Tax=Actinokineospora terrae TaxID=155974 RepID=A0A1H9XL73_9PSEU|nr:SdrD B-like domain-containing protein [Actinokineospora terrae]SES46577.1 hypothetical protein SAMN04487818_11653 [Actinokineospora terrae]